MSRRCLQTQRMVSLRRSKSATVRKILQSYYAEIVKHKVLSPDEEFQMFLKYKETNDPSIKEQIILSNLRFVVSVAKKYTEDEDVLMDIINEGNLGLIEAFDRFDYTLGFRYISFAVAYIRLHIDNYFNSKKNVINKRRTLPMQKVNKIIHNFTEEFGTTPTPQEIYNVATAKGDIKFTPRECFDNYVFTNANLGEYDDSQDGNNMDVAKFNSLTYSINEYNEVENADFFKDKCKRLMSCLSPMEAYVIRGIYGIGCTPKMSWELAETVGVSVAMINTHRRNAFKKMEAYGNKNRKALFE